MSTKQPSWHCIANLGDASPEDHDGAFVMIDKRGVYTPELWIVTIDTEDNDDNKARLGRVQLDQCYAIDHRYEVSDNKYHMQSPAWFGDAESIESLSSFTGSDKFAVTSGLTSSCPVERAHIYLDMTRYWGIDNWDGDGDRLAGVETRDLCKRMLEQIKEADTWTDGFEYYRITNEVEGEIHREWGSGNYDQAYGVEVDENNQLVRREAEPEEDGDHHWAYVLGYYSSFEDEEMPDWALDLRYEHKGTLDHLGISTD